MQTSPENIHFSHIQIFIQMIYLELSRVLILVIQLGNYQIVFFFPKKNISKMLENNLENIFIKLIYKGYIFHVDKITKPNVQHHYML